MEATACATLVAALVAPLRRLLQEGVAGVAAALVLRRCAVHEVERPNQESCIERPEQSELAPAVDPAGSCGTSAHGGKACRCAPRTLTGTWRMGRLDGSTSRHVLGPGRDGAGLVSVVKLEFEHPARWRRFVACSATAGVAAVAASSSVSTLPYRIFEMYRLAVRDGSSAGPRCRSCACVRSRSMPSSRLVVVDDCVALVVTCFADQPAEDAPWVGWVMDPGFDASFP